MSSEPRFGRWTATADRLPDAHGESVKVIARWGGEDGFAWFSPLGEWCDGPDGGASGRLSPPEFWTSIPPTHGDDEPAAETGPAATGWIRTADATPEAGRVVLIRHPDWLWPLVARREADGAWINHVGIVLATPTHWTPTPPLEDAV